MIEPLSTVQNVLQDLCYESTEIALASLLNDEPRLLHEGAGLALHLNFAVPVNALAADIANAVQAQAERQGLHLAALDLAQHIPAATDSGLNGVSNIVAVASGKGGVGKSTTAVNLSLALKAEGARVGLLDADIYGPSQALMLGVEGRRPAQHSERTIAAIDAHGIKMISMANLVTEKTPMVWRGPMASGALQQLLGSTYWGELDYLIIDMPPGTGDIALTLAQQVALAGALIVTTPQDIALLDAKKGIEMFRKVSVPVLGVLENMALHLCSNCGHAEAIFGELGGQRLAEEYGVPCLGSLPLSMSIREKTDQGVPSVVSEPESAVSQSYRQLARRVAAQLVVQANESAPEIVVED